MGKIQEQTIKGGIFSYLGAAMAALTTGFFMPHVLSEGEVGVSRLLMSWALIGSQVASLGFHSVTSRMFSHFRDTESRHRGYFGLGALVISVGFVITSVAYWLGLPWLRGYYINAPLFLKFVDFIIPLTFFTLLFNYVDTFFTQLYHAVRGLFLKEFASKVFVFISLGIYYFSEIGFEWFVLMYVISWSLPGLLMFIWVLVSGEVNWKFDRSFLTSSLRAEMISVAGFGLILGFSNLAIINIDGMMLASLLDVGATGIYTVAFFAGSLVVIPSRPLQKIAAAFYADAWKSSNLKKINEIYRKSSLNQFVVGGFMFLLLWVNIDSFFALIKPVYVTGKYVVFFIGLANWIEMTSGANVVLIATSRHYRMLTAFTLVLLVLIVTLNYLLIPRFGLTGAAIGSMFSALLYNLMRWGFLFRKYGLQPLRWKYLIVIALFTVVCYFLADRSFSENIIIEVLVKTTIASVLFGVPILLLKISEDLNNMFYGVVKKIFRLIGL